MATYNMNSNDATKSGGFVADTYTFSNGWGTDSITDSGGTDIVDLSAVTVNVTICLAANTDGGINEITDGTNTCNWATNIIERAVGGSGNDIISGTTAANSLTGGGGNDTLDGGTGNDSFNGGDGDDVIKFLAGWGADSISAEASGTDTVDLSGMATSVTINLANGAGNEITDGTNTVNWSTDFIENAIGGSAADAITGTTGANSLTGGGGNDTFVGGAGNDTLDGGSGSDNYLFINGWGTESIIDESGIEVINFFNGGVTTNLTINLTTGAGNEVTDGTNTVNWASDFIEYAYGGSGNDEITGNAANNILLAAGGNDTLDGGSGNDNYLFINGWGTESIIDGSGFDGVDFYNGGVSSNLTINLTTGAGNEVTDGTNTVNWASDFIEIVYGGSGNDAITGNAANNTLFGAGGVDTLDGGAGNDQYLFMNGWGTESIIDESGIETIDFNAGGVSSNLTINLTTGAGNEVTDGTNTVNWASDFIEIVYGGSGNDAITGNAANNTLIGVSGVDSLDGGAGDDTYLPSHQATITADSSGIDTLDCSNTGDLTINLISSAGNELNAGGGAYMNWVSDVIENVIFTISNNLVYGSSVANSIVGGSGSDTLNGGGGNDTLNGGTGNDSFDGGDGNDSYKFLAAWGVDIISADASGTDTVDFSGMATSVTINLTNSAGDEVTDGTNTAHWSTDFIENATGGTGNDFIWGNSSANSLVGGNGDDSFVGQAGNDTLDGGADNDTYGFADAWGTDNIIDSSGTVEILDFISFGVTSNLTINLTSGAGDEVTDGTNTVNWSSDVIEYVQSGLGNDVITGSSVSNILFGNAGNDTIDGAGGNDSFYGGDGNDTYKFLASWGVDTVIDSSGTDTLDFSGVAGSLIINLETNSVTLGTNSVSWTAGSIENIILNSSNNSIEGSSGSDTLNGGTGNDTLNGGTGNDFFDGGAGNDSYKFLASWGVDQISADSSGRDTLDFSGMATSVTINLSTNPGADEVTAGTNTLNWTGDLLENVTGGSAADSMTGNGYSNYVIGNGGDDTMDGDVGSDTYEFSGTWGADSIVDSAGAIDHLVLSAVTANLVINLASGGVGDEITDGTNTVNWGATVVIEKVTTGSGNDTIYGNSSNNLFEAGSGNDSMEGGSGNDIYVFGNSWGVDTITESAGVNDAISLRYVTADLVINLATNGSGDEVAAGANTINWASNAIEQVYSGSGADSITGNSARNVIYGGSGNDTIDGADGNDTYQFENNWGTDSITDGGGTDDSVDLSKVTVAMTINLGTGGTGDEVTAGGTNTINWTGDVANAIEKAYAGSGSDLIYGSSANNFLSGGGGNDTLYGLGGNDIYVFSASGGTDIINDASGADDKLSLRAFTIGAGPNQATFTAQDFNIDTFVDDLLVSFASGGSVTIKDYFDNSNADDDFSNPGTGRIETLVFSDDTSVPFAQVQTLIA